MPARVPSPSELADIAARHGLRLSPADLESFRALVAGTLASYDVVESLEQRPAPPAAPRESAWPAPGENPLNAWYVRTSIKGAQDGLLAGKRVAVKDNVCVAGLPMMNGSRTLEGFVPDEDATIVTRLLDAGAEITGKAVCEDLCFSGGSHTSATGPVRNPWDPARSAGGSSSGSAALVAAGEVELAIGGDQGGSIRIPSAYSGTVGLKPTWGLVPYTGAFPIELTLDHLGPIGRTVTDVAAMLQAVAGPDGQDPRQDPGLRPGDYLRDLDSGIRGLRIGLVREGFGLEISEPDVDETVRSAAQRLTDAGATVVEVSVPEHVQGPHIWTVIATEGPLNQMVNLNGYGLNYKGRYAPKLMETYAAGRRAHADELSETVKMIILAGQYTLDTYDGTFYARARNLEPWLRGGYDRALAEVDVLVMPTLPMKATVIPAPDASREEKVARALEMLPNTCPFDVTGHPALSVPAGLSQGLPVGMMIVGRHLDEATVLRTGRAFERLMGGFPTPEAFTG